MNDDLTINNIDPEKLYKVKEVMQIYRVTDRTARAYCKNGKFKHAVMIGKSWLIPGSDILKSFGRD